MTRLTGASGPPPRSKSDRRASSPTRGLPTSTSRRSPHWTSPSSWRWPRAALSPRRRTGSCTGPPASARARGSNRGPAAPGLAVVAPAAARDSLTILPTVKPKEMRSYRAKETGKAMRRRAGGDRFQCVGRRQDHAWLAMIRRTEVPLRPPPREPLCQARHPGLPRTDVPRSMSEQTLPLNLATHN